MNTERMQFAEEHIPQRKVETWRAVTDETYETGNASGIIESLFDGLIAYLQGMLREIVQPDVEPITYGLLERSATSLLFWGLNHGISQGDLDRSLQHSTLLRDTVLLVLISIGELLSQGSMEVFSSATIHRQLMVSSNIATVIEKAKFAVKETNELDQSFEVCAEPVEACKALQRKVDCLIALNASIECPAESESDDDEEARTGTVLQDLPAHQYFADLIAARFPTAQLEVVEKLGLANWSRYNHVQQQRDSLLIDDESVSVDKTRSEFHDSGLGSDPSRANSTYAATVVSSRAEASHKRLPTLPKDARDGKPFACEVCNRVISIRRMKDWRKHVFKDICAYTCIFPRCDSMGVLFEDLDSIAAHLTNRHCTSPGVLDTLCPLCPSHVKGPVDTAMLHLARHMEEIALGVLSHGGEEFEDNSEGSDSSESLGQRNFPPYSFPCQKCAGTFETWDEFHEHVVATHHDSRADLGNLFNPELDLAYSPISELDELSNTFPGNDVGGSGTIMINSNARLSSKRLPDVENTSPKPSSARTLPVIGPTCDYILDLADPKRTQKHPATFQCTLCPKKFTRVYNLRIHLRTHTDERPFVCNVCGKAFARQHDRKRHEGLHSGGEKFVCRGKLKDGNGWGCGRRFARADALGRHFRSESGRVCIGPLFEEEAESSRGDKEQQSLPAVLLAQVPELRGIHWDLSGKLEDELSDTLAEKLSETPKARAPLD